MTKRIEYLIHDYEDLNNRKDDFGKKFSLMETLNDLGEDGWELCAVFHDYYYNKDSDKFDQYVFKREY